MKFLNKMKKRKIQKKAEAFVKSLSKLSESEIEQKYAQTVEFKNNDIVLSYLFFRYPNLIKILPVDFQKSRINSNLDKFNYASLEARNAIISDWIKCNKLFMNAIALDLDDKELAEFIKMYFKQPEDISKLYMDDLSKVIRVLSELDLHETENLLFKAKDSINDIQWEYVIKVNPIFIKYASQNIQNKYTEDDKFSLFLNGKAREIYMEKQMDKIAVDLSLFYNASIEVKKEFIRTFPSMISLIDEDEVVKLIKNDSGFLKYINLSSYKNKEDKGHEIIYKIFDDIDNKSNESVIDLFIKKCLFNAKGKVYRYDKDSHNLTYQYTKRIIKVIQRLSVEQIINLINIDANYALVYLLPIYNYNTDENIKDEIIVNSLKKCIQLFEMYYDSEVKSRYIKIINAIFLEYMKKKGSYNFEDDYECILDVLKVLFNKQIINNNPEALIIKFIGVHLVYKGVSKEKASIKLLNELLRNAYNKEISNDKMIYDIFCLEKFDSRLDFIDRKLLDNFCSYNFVNISSLLYIIKDSNGLNLFKEYYSLYIDIYGSSKESLYKAVENFFYYYDILKDVINVNINQKDEGNFINLIFTYGNYLNITKKEELDTYEIIVIKRLLKELSITQDINTCKNLISNYLFNKSYNELGNMGWLETLTIKNICDVFDVESLKKVKINNELLFNNDEINLFRFIKLLFIIDNKDVLIQYFSVLSSNISRNIVFVSTLFSKIKKYKCEMINEEIMTIPELERLSIDKSDKVKKESVSGATVYKISGLDFKLLSSTEDDGIHYACLDNYKISKNCYGYNSLVKSRSIRFTSFEGKTLIKKNKDKIMQSEIGAEFIIVVGNLLEDIIKISKGNNLPIVFMENKNEQY